MSLTQFLALPNIKRKHFTTFEVDIFSQCILTTFSVSDQSLITTVVTIEAKTDCNEWYAEMNGDGRIKVKICQGARCCYTPWLDDPNKDDFEKCNVDDFSLDLIGTCQDFTLSLAEQVSVKLIHEGSDGWRGNFINVRTNGEKNFNCPVKKWLDGDDTLDLRCE